MNRLQKEKSIDKTSKSQIWIVEDNTLFRECLAEVINSAPNLECNYCFGSCEEAILFLESNVSPDILLLDIGLPGISGLEGIQKFKELDSSIQIIIITIYEDSERVFQAICAGAIGYLLKKSSAETIIEAVYEVLKGGSPINAQIARKVLTAFTSLNPQVNNYKLSDREEEILHIMTDGLTTKEISQKLMLSHHTINTYIRNIYDKLQVKNRSGAVAKAIKERL